MSSILSGVRISSLTLLPHWTDAFDTLKKPEAAPLPVFLILKKAGGTPKAVRYAADGSFAARKRAASDEKERKERQGNFLSLCIVIVNAVREQTVKAF